MPPTRRTDVNNQAPTRAELAAALIEEFANAIGSTLADGKVAVSAGADASGDGWRTGMAVSGTYDGTFTLWIDTDGAAAMARVVLGGDAPDEATIADMLREMWSQAASAACLKAPFENYKMTLDAAVAGPVDAEGEGFVVDFAGQGAATVMVSGVFETAQARPAQTVAAGGTTLPPNLEVVLDIELPLVVRFGRTVMSLKALSGLGPGSIVDMNRTPDDLVEIVVSDHVIARGEVVVVSGNYGVRVTELLNPADRIRALEV
jgi:flagellar motor switch protein FliN